MYQIVCPVYMRMAPVRRARREPRPWTLGSRWRRSSRGLSLVYPCTRSSYLRLIVSSVWEAWEPRSRRINFYNVYATRLGTRWEVPRSRRLCVYVASVASRSSIDLGTDFRTRITIANEYLRQVGELKKSSIKGKGSGRTTGTSRPTFRMRGSLFPIGT